MSTKLRMTHLRFDCVARQTIKLGREMAGDSLRNGLASVVLQAVCPERKRGREPTPEHAVICPACWLLAANIDQGEVRRAYAVVPPLPPRNVVQAGERFSFVLSLYGEGEHFLPYFVLAVPEVGANGIGPGRGQFELEAIWAADPFTERVQVVLPAGQQTVSMPETAVSWDGMEEQSALLLSQIERKGLLKVRFLTPTRLVTRKSLVKKPDFGVLFQRLLHRIDQLGQQFAGEGRRSYEEIMAFQGLANRVRLVNSQVRWVDIFSWSGRTRRKSPIGGFVGTATYSSEEWETLLPWLLWGQATQVGKLTVKGNGVFEVGEGRDGYWRWMFGEMGTGD